jgi:hypothetical protein
LAHLGDAAIDGVVADDPSAPAAPDQVVPRDDPTLGLRQTDQDLHDTGLHDFTVPRSLNLAGRRRNPQSAERESRFVRKIDVACFPGSILTHATLLLNENHRRIIALVGTRSAFGRGAVLSACHGRRFDPANDGGRRHRPTEGFLSWIVSPK